MQTTGASYILDRYLDDPFSGGLTWLAYLRSPLERVQRYLKLLGSILKRSDKSNPRHKFGELEKLTENMRVFGARCEVAVRQSFEKAEIDDLRSRMGDAGQRILPVGVEILHSQKMSYMGWWNGHFVTVLEIRKPDRAVIVLKDVPRSKARIKSTLAVLAEVSVPNPPIKCIAQWMCSFGATFVWPGLPRYSSAGTRRGHLLSEFPPTTQAPEKSQSNFTYSIGEKHMNTSKRYHILTELP